MHSNCETLEWIWKKFQKNFSLLKSKNFLSKKNRKINIKIISHLFKKGKFSERLK